MSWSIDFYTDSIDAAVDKVAAERYIPYGSKGAINEAIEKTGLPPNSILHVKSSGHVGSFASTHQTEIQYLPLVRAVLASGYAETNTVSVSADKLGNAK